MNVAIILNNLLCTQQLQIILDTIVIPFAKEVISENSLA